MKQNYIKNNQNTSIFVCYLSLHCFKQSGYFTCEGHQPVKCSDWSTNHITEMRVLYIRSEPAASVNSIFLWGKPSARKTKFNTSVAWRIHHHYDLITVAAENVLSFPAKVCVNVCWWWCSGDPNHHGNAKRVIVICFSPHLYRYSHTDSRNVHLYSIKPLAAKSRHSAGHHSMYVSTFGSYDFRRFKNLRTCKHSCTDNTNICTVAITYTHTHTANPCWVCEDISFWVDHYDEIWGGISEASREGKKERKILNWSED